MANCYNHPGHIRETFMVLLIVTGLWKTHHIVTHEINRITMFMLMQFQQVHTSRLSVIDLNTY